MHKKAESSVCKVFIREGVLLTDPKKNLREARKKFFTERSARSRRDWWDLVEISPWCLLDSKSWRDRGEMENISLRSRQDLESNKHHGEISARSLQSRRYLINLDEISVKILHGMLLRMIGQIESILCFCRLFLEGDVLRISHLVISLFCRELAEIAKIAPRL